MRIRGRVWALVGIGVVVLALIAGLAFAERVVQEDAAASFYDAPDPLPSGAPGEIIAVEEILTAPPGANAWRVMYHSRDLNGDDIAASGTVIAPAGPAPDGGRPIVSWAHPTTGAVARCAPSIGIAPLDLVEGLETLLQAGYVVAATDYPGMGVDGPSSYLLGISEGDSVLDAARAAQSIEEAGAGDDLLLWGHSQGGQAALFAAQLAPDYAPEFDLRAVAVAAPAADLATLLSDDIDDVSGVTIGAYAFDAFVSAYAGQYDGLSLESILTPAGAEATPTMADLCLLGQNGQLHDIARPLIGGYLSADPSTTEPWATMLRENSAGQQPIAVPVLVAQGAKDTLVEPSATEGFVDQTCTAGLAAIDFRLYPDATHGTIAFAAIPDVARFFASAIAGELEPQTCGTPW
jgi:alpha-beta hydrolase superfamily lysophospholipase